MLLRNESLRIKHEVAATRAAYCKVSDNSVGVRPRFGNPIASKAWQKLRMEECLRAPPRSRKEEERMR